MSTEPQSDGEVINTIRERQKKAEAHNRANEERAKAIAQLRAEYFTLKDHPVIKDIIEKGKAFSALHETVARDGVAARQVGVNGKGHPEYENVFLTNNKRVSEMDRSAGLLQLVDYIQRQIDSAQPKPKPTGKTSKKQ